MKTSKAFSRTFQFFGHPAARCPLVLLLLTVFLIRIAIIRAEAQTPPTSQSVSLEIRDGDLRTVLMDLAKRAGINLLLSPKVRGTITCRVTDMDPLDLIIFIARTNGLDYEDHGRIKTITADTPVDQGQLKFEIISLQNASAEKVAKMIETLKLDKRTHVVHDTHGNRLIVTWRE